MSYVNIENIKFDIEFMKEISDIKLIEKGYSGDIKYTFLKGDKNYLVRFNKMNQLDRAMPNLNKAEKLSIVVDYMNRAFEDKVRCPKVYDYGILHQYNITYIITSFIDGEVAEDALKQISSNEQYLAGYELGIDLNRLHQLKFSIPTINWVAENIEPYNKKMNYYNNNREKCETKLDEKIEKDLENYISKHQYLLTDREIKLIHNDVHTGNIIIKNGKYAGLIDFNELKYGDQFFEHKYLRLSDVVNFPSFCKGVVDGYFDEDIPPLFWKLTYLYNALQILTYLPMPHVFTEEEIKFEMEWNNKSYEVYTQYKELIPKWYKG